MSTERLESADAPAGEATTARPPSARAPALADLYGSLFDREAPDGDSVVDERFVRLRALDDLHFLDRHACSLLARARYTPVLLSREPAPDRLQARVAAHVVAPEEEGEGAAIHAHYDPARGESIDYEPGALLRRVFRVHNWRTLWHNYLTSRDRALDAPPAGATLGGKHPHLRLGFVAGADLFNRGEFYRAHEEWEGLWMRLGEGTERALAQGLIQLAGAHIHRLKRRPHEAGKLFALASEHLASVRDADEIGWLDVPALLAGSTSFFQAPALADATALAPAPAVTPRVTHPNVARKHR